MKIIINCIRNVNYLLKKSTISLLIISQQNYKKILYQKEYQLKKKSGELSLDETKILTPFQKSKAIYFQILDTVKMSINDQFVPNKNLLLDISWLDPAKYKEITLLSIEDF